MGCTMGSRLAVGRRSPKLDICPCLKTVSAICMNAFKVAMILHSFLDEFNGDIQERH